MLLDFWFDFASTYSYVAAMRVEAAAQTAGVEVRWRPFLLGPLFQAQLGIKDSPFNFHPVRKRYMWRDLERLCERYQLPWKRPTVMPRDSLLAARVTCAVKGQPCVPELVRSIFSANFARDEDIADPSVLSGILRGLGVEPEPVLARATSDEVKAFLRAETEEASRLGMFGAPNFVVGGELFFGQDRMEHALDWARRA